jgi:hypothetical protein
VASHDGRAPFGREQVHREAPIEAANLTGHHSQLMCTPEFARALENREGRLESVPLSGSGPKSLDQTRQSAKRAYRDEHESKGPEPFSPWGWRAVGRPIDQVHQEHPNGDGP